MADLRAVLSPILNETYGDGAMTCALEEIEAAARKALDG